MNDDQSLARAVEALPLGPLRAALAGLDSYLVGGTVRALIAGFDPGGDLDIAVDGELAPLLGRLQASGVEVHERHARFATATVLLDGARVDVARTRRETYSHPGALPEVEPAPLDADLARRDFTVNAVAVGLDPPYALHDPFDGVADLRRGVLRALHDRSFVDDPTRALRAARYAARLDLEPEPRTLELLRQADLTTLSADRRRAELARLAAEASAARGFGLLAGWGLIALPRRRLELITAIDDLAAAEPWGGDPALRSRAILLAVEGGERAEAALTLATTSPERPSEAVRFAAGRQDAELLLVAAAGAPWIDEYMRSWRAVELEINGADLIAAGIPEGPAVGAGLRGALERKLDGDLDGGREAELAAALEAARRSS